MKDQKFNKLMPNLIDLVSDILIVSADINIQQQQFH